MTNPEVAEMIGRGYRMPQPEGCSPVLYNTILDCWKADPYDRPTFEFIHAYLEDFFTAGVDKGYQFVK